MLKLTFPVKSFRRLDDPFNPDDFKKKYRFYVNTKDVPEALQDWMETNPREQKLTTDVAEAIRGALREDNRSFHLWNRGILLSAEAIEYDNKSNFATISLSDPQKHGNIDGGHTFRIIIEQKNIPHDQFVEFEVITGIDSPEQLAEARNTSVQVDTKSIEELKKSFEAIKQIINHKGYFSRIAFKQNQYYEEGKRNIIDVREIIAIINMFNQRIFPISNRDVYPIQSYTGKETSLNKFLGLDQTTRDNELKNMSGIIPDIFDLWDLIETTFAEASKRVNKRYGSKTYSNYEAIHKEGKIFNALFSNKQLLYTVPRGLMYPLVAAFRALITVNCSGIYLWKKDPKVVWEEHGKKLASIILASSEEQSDNPNAVGKSMNTWDNLFKELYISVAMTD